jgi:hypothetical protein
MISPVGGGSSSQYTRVNGPSGSLATPLNLKVRRSTTESDPSVSMRALMLTDGIENERDASAWRGVAMSRATAMQSSTGIEMRRGKLRTWLQAIDGAFISAVPSVGDQRAGGPVT